MKKVNRKAILEVDVPKTCRIIITPDAPMALRLQSNLLYGVSRVYSQQCGYILSDAQIAQANMRALLKAVKTSELDPNAGKTRPDQLVLPDNPAFLPDFALPGLDVDLSALDISTDDSSRRSSLLLPHSQRSSISSQQELEDSMLGLIIPSSVSAGVGDLGGFVLHSEHVSSAQRSAQFGQPLVEEDEDFNFDPGFALDAEGNIIEEPTTGPNQAPREGMPLGSEAAVSTRMPQEMSEGLQPLHPEREPVHEEIGLPILGDDDDNILHAAEPFPAMTDPGRVRAQHLSPSEVRDERESSESAWAPLPRKRRVPKQLPVDARQELHNADLAQWKANYIENMAEATEAKKNHKAPALAKKNAAFWVMGAGIGGVGAGIGASKLKSPLDMFSGGAMMEALTGIKASIPQPKRGRDDEEGDGSDSEARRVRMRVDDSEQIGRGDELHLEDNDETMISAGEGIEVARHAQAPLEDSPFPWNVSSGLGSRQGSVIYGRGFASSIGGLPTSAGRPSSIPGVGTLGPGSLERRTGPVTSASPLIRRGRERYSSLEIPAAGDDSEILGGHHLSDEFQMYGPGAAVDTQTAMSSQWVRSTLDQEASNFLAFVEAKISTIAAPEDEEEDELAGRGQPKGSITFEKMLPPQENTKIVAAQGLYHLLALATKSLINVEQTPANGPINVGLPARL
ncbi:R8 protein [Lecanora helva]